MEASKIKKFKELFDEFKSSNEYRSRKEQSKFVPFARKIINETLKSSNLTNEKLTSFVNIFSPDCRVKNFKKYINECIQGEDLREEFISKFISLDKEKIKGYTRPAVRTITYLTPEDLFYVKDMLIEAMKVKNVEEAREIVDRFSAKGIKRFLHHVYSPWLHYINPAIFPIINEPHKSFREWIGSNGNYGNCIVDYYQLLNAVGEVDYGQIDTFLRHIDIKEDKLMIKQMNTVKSNTTEINKSLNTILYGPPGTGKTFHSISYAVAIVEGKSPKLVIEEAKKDRLAIKKRFDDHLNNGLVVFTTFHQSMSYEDFIEGIKPLPPEKDQDLKYDVVDGIFKNLCRSAESNWLSYNRKGDNNVTFEDVFDELKEKWEADTEMKFGMKTEGKEFTITGFSNKSIYFKKASGREGHTLSINTLRDIYYKKRATWGNGVGIYYPGIIEKLEYAVPIYKENPSEPNNYVIIIDEINRGNVSQIFGELITLLEDDKRIGAKEALKITLPYSGDQFAVPPNLSVVGTMNTADRSVEALDTALRRRFSFVPMAPEPEELKKQAGQVNLQTLLRTLNNRLIILKDADHTIGHALLWEVDSIEKLKAAFENKILPLLQEYFYNDYEKLGLVLGDAFFQLPHKRVGGNEFALFSGSSGLSGQYKNKYIYKLKNAKDLEEADFLTLTQAPAINEDQ